ncbi:PIN domain-containing protein [soil metagenome]
MSVKPLFVDTAYIYALFNKRDKWHEKAIEWQQKIALENRRLLTTQFILTEIGDGLSPLKLRQSAANIIHALDNSEFVEIISASSELFLEGLNLYENRLDKDWGLTDCISFVVMENHDLSDVLTTDNHFRQAGFRALLLETE